MATGRIMKDMGDISEARLWKTLDSITERLSGIESQLSDVVRLEEKIINHEQALKRYGNRLDSHEMRIRDAELWQAHYGDKSSVERLITNVQEELTTLRDDVSTIQKDDNVVKGQRDVGKEVLKWISGVCMALVVFMVTRGSGE